MKLKLPSLLLALLLCLAVGLTAFAEDTIYTEGPFRFVLEDGAATVVGYFGSDTTVYVPEKLAGAPVDTIAEGAFIGSGVKKVCLPDTITEVEGGAFETGVQVVYDSNLAPAPAPKPTSAPSQTEEPASTPVPVPTAAPTPAPVPQKPGKPALTPVETKAPEATTQPETPEDDKVDSAETTPSPDVTPAATPTPQPQPESPAPAQPTGEGHAPSALRWALPAGLALLLAAVLFWLSRRKRS